MERKSDFQRRLAEDLKDPEFKKEWDALELEYQIQAALMQARIDADMTQAELAKKSGVRQSNISRIESGAVLPRLDTLETLARAMGKRLQISMISVKA
jgi:DNA-binding XRE family transcriptional regulator